MPLLETDALTVRFGGVVAVHDVSVWVDEGSLTGLIGPNGAGKTTWIDAVSGLVPSTGGITFGGRSMTGWAPHKRAQAGIGRTFQGLELFDDLTVRENLLVSAEATRRWSVLSDLIRPVTQKNGAQGVAELVERLGIAHLAGAYPPQLSMGERKLVSIGRALSGGARLVLLDEPAAGLNSEDSLGLGQTLRTLVASGCTVLLVDHDMGLVMSVCDMIHVLEFGKLIASGSSEEIRQDDRVIEAYLGEQSRSDGLGGAPAG